MGSHRREASSPGANRTAPGPTREALSNGARASTRTYPITAHRRCHCSRPSRVAWHPPPLLPNKKDARGSHKKPGELLIALSLWAEAQGLFLQPCRDPATQAHIRGGSANNPSFRTKRMHEGPTKKTGKLLIALLLRAEARGLFLQPSRGPATRTRTRGLGKHDKTPPSERKGCARAAQKRQGNS